ncbi:MAG: M6 family metalloprotease domain-containing protein [Candidatus Eisenbacteria bacterium]
MKSERLPGRRAARAGLPLPSITLSLVLSLLILFAAPGEAGPRFCGRPPGEPLPGHLRVLMERPDRDRAPGGDEFVRRLERIQANRRAVAAGQMTAEEARLRGGIAITGHQDVPVFPFLYDNTPVPPFSRESLEEHLFTGPWFTGTAKEYFTEVSYGQFTIDGVVADWYPLPEIDTYYEGSNNGSNPATDKFGEAMYEILAARDPEIDFGLFDNDGDDGIPNSGDDDGKADWVVFITPENDGACAITTCPFTGSDNIWSHQWYLSQWDGTYTTDDERTGGGNIKVDRYFVSAGRACDVGFPNGIGTFCHEFGHVLGLGDYYDGSGHSEGIGHWGIMGSGGWNTTDLPSHMTAWAKEQLGWLYYFNVNQDQTLCLPPVETNPIAARLWTSGEEGQQYFVVENRQPIGFDSGLHAPGLVIYHIDETVSNNNHENHKRIDVECADAFTAEHVVDADHLDLGRCIGGNRGDAGDPWCPATQTTFDGNSIPDSRSYSGAPTGVAVRDISTCDGGVGGAICADFEVGVTLTADLCMQDCDSDGCAEISSCEPWWATPALWIDHNGDGIDDLPSEDMENVLWYKVWNAGPEPLAGATIEIYTHIPGLGLRWPEAGELLASETIDEVILSGASYVDSVKFVYPPTPPNVDHYCIGARVQHDLDQANSQYPPHDDNLVQVNHQILVERAEGGFTGGGGHLTGGPFSKTSRLRIHEGGAYYGRLLEVRLGSPPTFDDWSLPETWTLQFDSGPYLPPPGMFDSLDVVVGSAAAEHGETAHIPLTLWDVENGAAAGGVILDYRIDDNDPTPPAGLEAECLPIVLDQIGGPSARLDWPEVTLDINGLPEVIRYYEVYRGDNAGNPETLVERVIVDGDFDAPGFQWFDYVLRDSGVVYGYRVKAVDGAGNESGFSPSAGLDFLACEAATGVESPEAGLPRGLHLAPPSPNPSPRRTTLTFTLPASQLVRLNIFDVRGRRIASLVDGEVSAGSNQAVWSGMDGAGNRVPPGVYFARLEGPDFVETRKIVLLGK